MKKSISSIQQVIKTGTQIVEYTQFQKHEIFIQPPINQWKQLIMDNFEWFLLAMFLVYCVTFFFMYKIFSKKSNQLIAKARKESATSDELQNSIRIGTDQNEKQRKDQTSSTDSSPRIIQKEPENNQLALPDHGIKLQGRQISEQREKIIQLERNKDDNTIKYIETNKVIRKIKADDEQLEFVTHQFIDFNKKNAIGVHMIEQDNGDGKPERIIHILTDWSRYCLNGKFQNNYTSHKLIGKGTFGEVYKCQKIIDLQEYAIKRIFFKVKNEKSLRDHSIFREIKSLQEINHKNIVRYYTSWIQEETTEVIAEIKELNQLVAEQQQAQSKESQNSYHPQLMDEMSYMNDYVQFVGGENDAENEQQIQTISKQSKTVQSFHLSDFSSQIQSRMRRLHFNPNQKDEQYQLFTLYIEMELCNSTLKDFIDEVDRKKDYPKIKSIFIQILEGIIYMHDNLYIHRDLKPQNIFINSKKEVKIGDLGLCNSIINKRDDDLSYSSSEFTNNVGTPMYMAPEVKEDQYGPAADIYSLGIILFEMMWKIKTHSEKTKLIQALTKDSIIPFDLQKDHPVEAELIQLMVNKNPQKRPTAQKILETLKQQ
ncbi:unnamed protein product [Paramecium pentaurelia]|uniref:non-specific serine/threonine protein kinase n=1 Tax=Paramecium pentaurelia TaxID=43138 RepID=A0A8S1T0W8_9CILI|nr:unnamed protein product [Paramecium pentaurelia]